MAFDATVISTDRARPVQAVRVFCPGTGQQYGFVTGSTPVTIGDLEYSAGWAVQLSPLGQDVAMSGDAWEVIIPSTHPLAEIFSLDSQDFPWQVQLIMGNYTDLSFITVYEGSLVSALFTLPEDSGEGSTLHLTFNSWWARMEQAGLVHRYESSCQHTVYMGGCNLNKDTAGFFTDCQIQEINVNRVLVSSALTGYQLEGGLVRAPNGIYRTIQRSVAGPTGSRYLYLDRPFRVLSVGDAVRVYRGCRRSREDCVQQFNNERNRLRFDVPKQDPMTKGL